MKRIAVGLVGCLLLAFLLGAAEAPTTAPAPVLFPPPPDGHEARRIVFVCDVSGATINGAVMARRELRRAVRSLVGAQSFDLVLTGSDEPLLFAKTLVPASEQAREDACDWLEKAGTRPRPSALSPALQAAFPLKPELIYLIENRNSADPEATLKQVRSLNRDQAVRIHVTALIGDPKDAGWTQAFQEIAQRNGGKYTPVQLPDSGFDPALGLGGSIFALAPEQANVKRIVFVCDCSGSILNKFHSLAAQLEKAVNGLRPTQSFNLIFMGEQSCNALGPNPVPATPENKRDAITFLHDKVTPRGETNPIPALETAFAQKPQVIFLLTDGDFPDNHAALKRIRELNADRMVSVNTIAFVEPSDTETDFYKLLQAIADENGGQYKVVKEDELKP
ncbi:MAG TPA: VWA domain-containing protein [Tepidisphaeraceae bacterium]